MGFVRQRLGWLVLGFVTILGGIWELTPVLINHIYRADGYAFLHQALEVLGDEISEPDFCVEGGVTDPQALNLLAQAVGALEQAREARPTDAQTLILLGRAYCLTGSLEEAVEAYEGYSELRPESPLGWLEGGFALETVQEDEAAVQAWEKAGLSPEQFIEIGQQKQAKENLIQAQNWFKNSILLEPGYAESWYWVGYTKELQNDFEGALEAYKKAIHLDETLLIAHFGIARIYKGSNEIELALEAYQSITEVDKASIEAYLEIGQIEDQRGDIEKALEAFQAAVQLGEAVQGNQKEQVWKRAWPKYLLGNLYLRLERFSEAKLSYESAVVSDPLNHYSEWSLWGLGRVANAEQMYAPALEYLNQTLALTPNYYLRSQVYLQMSIAYQGQGEEELFLTYLSKAHEEDLENKGLYLLYANSLIENGKLQQGIEEYKNYLNKWPNDLSVAEKLMALETLLKTQSEP